MADSVDSATWSRGSFGRLYTVSSLCRIRALDWLAVCEVAFLCFCGAYAKYSFIYLFMNYCINHIYIYLVIYYFLIFLFFRDLVEEWIIWMLYEWANYLSWYLVRRVRWVLRIDDSIVLLIIMLFVYIQLLRSTTVIVLLFHFD